MMLTRRSALGLALISMSVLTSAALAGEKATFDKAAFEAAQRAGKPILVEIAASWCPTCKAQAPILGALRGEPRFKDLVTITVDFDSQKPVVNSFKAQMQSTLIVFRGDKEVGRLVGDTRRESIEALLTKAL